MKILLVNFSDIKGGAARATYRLHKSLLVNGIDSKMLVVDKDSDDFTVFTESSKIQRGFNKFRPYIDLLPLHFYKNKSNTFFSISWLSYPNLIKKINKMNPDIVHLHWINKGMIKIEDLVKIKAPIIWSLHDNWAFTGGCHIMWECEKYKINCGSCPRLESEKQKDLSSKVFKRKKKVFKKLQSLTIVGLSRWLNDCSKNSALLKDKQHINLPNPIDTNHYKIYNKMFSREVFNLPKDKKLILFGAIGATSDENKGYEKLYEALLKISNKNIELVILGSSEARDSKNLVFNTHYLGHLHDDVSLVTLYNAVDIMVVPSIQENLSNVIMESLACATPVVGFNIGGNSDMIEHKKNGYLAKPFDTFDLARGIEWILYNTQYKTLCKNAREKVISEFESNIVSKKYIDLYRKILKINSFNEI